MTYIRYYITDGVGDVSDNTQTSADDPNNTSNQTTPSSLQSLLNTANSIFT